MANAIFIKQQVGGRQRNWRRRRRVEIGVDSAKIIPAAAWLAQTSTPNASQPNFAMPRVFRSRSYLKMHVQKLESPLLKIRA